MNSQFQQHVLVSLTALCVMHKAKNDPAWADYNRGSIDAAKTVIESNITSTALGELMNNRYTYRPPVNFTQIAPMPGPPGPPGPAGRDGAMDPNIELYKNQALEAAQQATAAVDEIKTVIMQASLEDSPLFGAF